MTDPQRRAVEAIAQYEMNTFTEPASDSLDFYIPWAEAGIAALREANLVILDRETVKLAVRWGEFVEDYGSDTAWTMTYDAPALKQMQDALGGREGAMGESDN